MVGNPEAFVLSETVTNVHWQPMDSGQSLPLWLSLVYPGFLLQYHLNNWVPLKTLFFESVEFTCVLKLSSHTIYCECEFFRTVMRGRRDVEDFLQSSSEEETSSNEAEAEENLLIEENHPLHLAAAKGHTPYLEALLNNGSSPHCYNQYGNTLLHLAAMFGHLSSVTLLLDRGADIHARNKYGNTLLHCASMNGHRAVIELLVEKGLDIEATNNAGSTPLHYAGNGTPFSHWLLSYDGPCWGNEVYDRKRSKHQPCK